jgi:2-dehydro-3-deoxygluconokinase
VISDEHTSRLRRACDRPDASSERGAVITDLVTTGETMALLASPEVGRLRDMTSLRLSIGGSESNVAICVSRLGRSAAWIGRVGDDEFGHLILATLRREGVDVSAAITDASTPTAIMLKERRTAEVLRVTYYRNGYAGSHLCPEDLDEELIGSARTLHITGITLGLSATARAAAYTAVEIARQRDTVVSFDFNYRAALWSPADAVKDLRDMASRADVVFAGEDEIALIDGTADALEVATKLTDGGKRELVVMQGARGAACISGGNVYRQDAFPVRPTDPVGAGDAFVAGYLVGLLEGADVPIRLRQACAAGAFAVTVIGDWEGSPSRADLALLGYDGGTALR